MGHEKVDIFLRDLHRILASKYKAAGPNNVYFFTDVVTGNINDTAYYDEGLDSIMFWCVYYGLVGDEFLLKNQDIEIKVIKCKVDSKYVKFKSKEPGLLVIRMDDYCVACNVGNLL